MAKHKSHTFTFVNEMTEKIIRIMTFSLYDAHSKPLFEQLQILDLKKLIIHRIALMMYKHSVHLLPDFYSVLFWVIMLAAIYLIIVIY